MTLALPDDLEADLRRVAESQGRPMEEVTLDILRDGLRDDPAADDNSDLATVVAAIRATPPNAVAI